MKKYLNIAFYKFVALDRLKERRDEMRRFCAELNQNGAIRGTVLLASEGINSILAGDEPTIRRFLEWLTSQEEFSGLTIKESWSSGLPFMRTLVKIKKEIIPLGRTDLEPHKETGARMSPAELKKWLDENRDFLLLDTRNDYEVGVGTFDRAQEMQLKTFRDFGNKLREIPSEMKKKPVVMFCTGGIRCEKATALALKEGFTDVYQLEGGILKYFEEVGGAHYRGDCFVFDYRRAVSPELKEVTSEYNYGKR